MFELTEICPMTKKTNSPKPKYDKPWCWTCRGHRRYKVVEGGGSSDGSYRGRTRKTYCRSCNERMWKPSLMDLNGIRFGCGLVYFPPVVLGTLALIIWGGPNPANDGDQFHASNNSDHFLGIGAIVLIFIAIPAGLFLWSSQKYKTWREWAEEHGWEGEKS